MTSITAQPPATASPDAIVALPGQAPVQPPATDPRPGGDVSGPRPGVRRRGDPNLAPRCGARARTTGCACRAPAMANGRCRMHGGKSTGPRTAEGLVRLAAARTTHGKSCATKRAQRRYVGTLTARMRLLAGATRLRDFLTSDLAARLSSGPAELRRPAEPAAWGATEISDRTPCTLQPPGDAPAAAGRGRRAAGPQPPRGQAAERAAARAERAAQAPWRAGIARARLVKRVVLAAWRKERAENARQKPMHLYAAGAGRVVPRKAHTPLDGAGMGVVRSGVKLGSTEAAAGGGTVIIPTGPHATHATGHLSRWLDGAGPSPSPLRGSPWSASRPKPAKRGRGEEAGRSGRGFRTAREEATHPTTRRWPLGGLKGRLCAGTDLSSAAFDIAEVGGWGVVVAACEAVQAGQAASEGSVTKPMNSGGGGGTAGADAILAALANRAARPPGWTRTFAAPTETFR